MTIIPDPLDNAVIERDRILVAMDVDAAKSFIVRHGGHLSRRSLDWIRVLHLARLEVTSMPDDLRDESLDYLAKVGAQRATQLRLRDPYMHMAIGLLFPKVLTDAFVAGLSR